MDKTLCMLMINDDLLEKLASYFSYITLSVILIGSIILCYFMEVFINIIL